VVGTRAAGRARSRRAGAGTRGLTHIERRTRTPARPHGRARRVVRRLPRRHLSRFTPARSSLSYGRDAPACPTQRIVVRTRHARARLVRGPGTKRVAPVTDAACGAICSPYLCLPEQEPNCESTS
jgi:hypothetical protein